LRNGYGLWLGQTHWVDYLLIPFMMVIFFSAYIAIFALPVALPMIVFTEYSEIRAPNFYAVAGVLTALAGLKIYLYLMRDTQFQAAWISIPPGLTGGLTYWAIAGRRAGAASG
jgi:hypothetical protein